MGGCVGAGVAGVTEVGVGISRDNTHENKEVM